jgi:hypothetical protein
VGTLLLGYLERELVATTGQTAATRDSRLIFRGRVYFGRSHSSNGEQSTQEDAVKYMMLINLGEKARDYANMSPEEQKEIAAAWQGLNQIPGVTPGIGLEPPETATTVRVADGNTLTTDGPFVETKEALDGYFVYEGDDLDAAIDVASRVPAVNMGGAVEVRPIKEW